MRKSSWRDFSLAMGRLKITPGNFGGDLMDSVGSMGLFGLGLGWDLVKNVGGFEDIGMT